MHQKSNKRKLDTSSSEAKDTLKKPKRSDDKSKASKNVKLSKLKHSTMEIETPKKKETNPDIFDSEASSPALDTSRLAHTMAFSMRPAPNAVLVAHHMYAQEV